MKSHQIPSFASLFSLGLADLRNLTRGSAEFFLKFLKFLKLADRRRIRANFSQIHHILASDSRIRANFPHFSADLRNLPRGSAEFSIICLADRRRIGGIFLKFLKLSNFFLLEFFFFSTKI